MERALASQSRAEALRPRLLERGDHAPIALPPWLFDDGQGECTTVVLLAPPPTQFLVHVHPWANLPSTYMSSAGAVQLTRCGRDRASLVRLVVEMRSPRAVLHVRVAVGHDPPPPLAETLPERDAGRAAPAGDPGPPPPRLPLATRLASFEARAKNAGAVNVATQLVPRLDFARVALEPGCHRWLVTGPEGAKPFVLLLTERVDAEPQTMQSDELPDVGYELCTARARNVFVRVIAPYDEQDRTLVAARFALPSDLPERFGPEIAEKLTEALGGADAPRRLGTLVFTTLGAQGRTPLPRQLLPSTCYVAAAVVAHGRAQRLSLGVRAPGLSRESVSDDPRTGPRLAFCTGARGEVDLDVEARGLGLAWLFVLFQAGPARPSSP